MPPTIRDLRILALFVDFPDARGARIPASDWDAAERLRRWYDQVSYGRLRIDVQLVPRWLSMRYPTGHYVGERVRDVFAEAVTAVDADVDFSRVDALYVTPSVGADGGWIVITDDLLTADGKRLRACDIGRGQVARFAVGGIRFQLLRKLPDGSYRIRVTRSR